MVGGAQYVPRKPVPASSGSEGLLKPLTQIVPDSHIQPPTAAQPITTQHSRTRTSSSSALPSNSLSSFSTSPKPPSNPSHVTAMYATHSRRTLSNATTSTTTTGGGPGPARTSSSTSPSLRRSGSARSNLNPTSYVALMRKQKATVWCDRAQNEDPRVVAQRKNARMRAALEAQSGNGRSSTLVSSAAYGNNMRGKIHRGKPASAGYTPADLVGGVGGVPMRLSASEVGDEGNNDNDSQNGHHRTGSGRSSTASNTRYTGMHLRPSNTASPHRLSHGSTPPGVYSDSPNDPPSDPSDTPMPTKTDSDYFAQPTHTGISTESGSSGERENSFGNVGKLALQVQPAHTALNREKSTKNPDELRRRGSIDERTSTMSGVRLYIANPDMDD